ncbi:MAG: acetate--CoA ligase family protein [Polyangiales bacterium]
MRGWTVFCDEPSLVVELTRRAETLGFAPRLAPCDLEAARQARSRDEAIAWVSLTVPSASELAQLAVVRSPAPLALAVPGSDRRDLAAAAALGWIALEELAPLSSACVLAGLDLTPPFQFSDRLLEASDRRRLARHLDARRGSDALRPADGGLLALDREGTSHLLGEARDVASALDAIRRRAPDPRPAMPRVDGVEPRSVLDVILGPPRELSDPASKAALAAYDVPLPLEEVCSSPSRAASEAGRIGFPVRIALASPDLRIWDHPDLVAEGVENAARARDVFRQVMALARARAPEARLLGVTVSATSATEASLHVDVRCVHEGLALAELRFADPHGLACDDRTYLALPCTPANLERALSTLEGASLLLGNGPADRRARVHALGDALLRVAAFTHDWRAEVSVVRLRPLVLLVDGSVELREASVVVTDAFERRLQ